MAQKAEEYGSPRQDLRDPGRRHGPGRRRRPANAVLEQAVEAGDILRACQTKDDPIRDWVKLAVNRARATGAPAVFWLDETRAHDAQADRQGAGSTCPSTTPRVCDIEIMAPAEATRSRSSASAAARTPSR